MRKKKTFEDCKIYSTGTETTDYDILVRQDESGFYHFYYSEVNTSLTPWEGEFTALPDADVRIEDVADVQNYLDEHIAEWTDKQFGCFVN